MVSIVILTVAIIPMVGMFDSGLKAAVLGGNYDKARAAANTKLEEVKLLTPGEVRSKYSPGVTKSSSSDPEKTPVFAFEVRSWYTNRAFTVKSSTANTDCSTCLIVEVKVTWDGNKTYTTTGFKA